jgi:aminomethyltransferase
MPKSGELMTPSDSPTEHDAGGPTERGAGSPHQRDAGSGSEGAPERRSPLHDAHVSAGASFTDFAGWQMPVRYSSELAEHHAVRTAAGLFDLSHMGEVVILGPEAPDALDYALSGELSALAVHQAKYTLMLGRNGGIIDDLVVYRTGPDRFMIVANAANRETVVAELRERTAPFDAEVYDESDDIALIAIQGPAALGILSTVDGFAVVPDEDGALADEEDFPSALASLRYYWSMPATFQDHPVLIARTGYTGEDGFELYIAPEQSRALWDALLEQGAAHGLVPAGLASRDTLRLEAGMPLYGNELDEQTHPAQAGLGRVVNYTKKVDFVGRSATEEGPAEESRVLVGLTGQGKRAARAGYLVFPDWEEPAGPIGIVTSGALSPTLGIPVAMAYVEPSFSRPGTEVLVDIRGSRAPYLVTALPFYRRKKN